MTPSPPAHDAEGQAGDRPSWRAEPGACFLGLSAMPPSNAAARIFVAVDLSSETDGALRCAEDLRASRPVVIDVYYLWAEDHAPVVDAADRAIAAVASFARTAGAWDRLDRLNALVRRGMLEVPGWLTRACCGGSSLAGIAAREGYDIVVMGLASAPKSSHRFELHRLQGNPARVTSSSTVVNAERALAGRLL